MFPSILSSLKPNTDVFRIEQGEVNTVHMGMDEMKVAWENKEIDGAFIWNLNHLWEFSIF